MIGSRVMEYRKRCRVCGKIYCFSDKDLAENKMNTGMAIMSAIGGVAGAIGGTRLDAYAMNNQTDRYDSKIIDYKKCPSCNSTDIEDLTDELWEEYQIEQQNAGRVITINTNASYESLKTRIIGFLEEKDYTSARAYCNQLLDMQPDDGDIYFYLFMADQRLQNEVGIVDWIYTKEKSIYDSKQGANIKKFASDELKEAISQLEIAALTQRYNEASALMRDLSNQSDLEKAKALFDKLGDFEDSKEKKRYCIEAKEKAYKNQKYEEAIRLFENSSTVPEWEKIISILSPLNEWKDASDIVNRCYKNIKVQQGKQKKKKVLIGTVLGFAVAIILVFTAINRMNVSKYEKQWSEALVGNTFVRLENGEEWNLITFNDNNSVTMYNPKAVGNYKNEKTTWKYQSVKSDTAIIIIGENYHVDKEEVVPTFVVTYENGKPIITNPRVKEDNVYYMK